MRNAFVAPFVAVACLLSLSLRAAAPTVTLHLPAPYARLTNGVLTLAGRVTGSTNISRIRVLLNGNPFPNGDRFSIELTNPSANWSTNLNLASLVAGTNTVYAWAVDAAGNQSPFVQRQFFFVVPSRLTVSVQGRGAIFGPTNGAVLAVGQGYSLTGLPSRGQTFADWNTPDGAVLSTNATLSFVMQTNLTLVARFVTNLFVPLKGVYAGLFTNAIGPLAPTNVGYLTVTLTSGGVGSGKVRLGKKSYPFAVLFSFNSGRAAVFSTIYDRNQNPVLYLNLVLNPDPRSGQLTGQVTEAKPQGWAANLWAKRAVYLGNPPPGRFNFCVGRLADDGSRPNGYGFGSVIVHNNGNVVLGLSLADSVPSISTASALASGGSFPFYTLLPYRLQGVALGWIIFTNQPNVRDLYGANVLWLKPPNAARRFYPNGFSELNVNLLGARYIAPARGQNVFRWTAGALRLGEAGLNEDGYLANLTYVARTNGFVFLVDTNAFAFQPCNPCLPTLTLGRDTGRINGTFPLSACDPCESKRSFHGVILPKSDLAPFPLGLGFFLDPDTGQSGHVLLQPR